MGEKDNSNDIEEEIKKLREQAKSYKEASDKIMDEIRQLQKTVQQGKDVEECSSKILTLKEELSEKKYTDKYFKAIRKIQRLEVSAFGHSNISLRNPFVL